jgi:transcriptional regulator with XRE-family HTH domain
LIFVERLKLCRQKKNLTQKQVATGTKISYRAYQGYESGKVNPTMNVLIALADFFDVSLDYLVGRTDEQSIIATQKLEAKSHYIVPNPRLLAILQTWEGATPEEKDKMFRALSGEEQEDVERQVAG